VALVGRIPDALVVLQRRYERADVVPRDAARTVDRAIALEGVRDYLVLRRSVQEAGRRQGDEGARGHLHGGEMRGEHYGASSACERRVQMLGALDAQQLREALGP